MGRVRLADQALGECCWVRFLVGLLPVEFLAALLAPRGTVFDDPVEKRALEADVVPGFFALKPLVDENFFPFGKKLTVKDGVFDEIRIF